MKFINSCTEEIYTPAEELLEKAGSIVLIKGFIHKIRVMSGFAFIIVRTCRDLIQCVYSGEWSQFSLEELSEGCAVELSGMVIRDERAVNGFEIHPREARVLSRPAGEPPVVVNKKSLNVTLDTNLTYRSVSLRNPAERAIFKIQEGIARGFREYLQTLNFTEIRTPKIVFAGAEGGANIFKLDYFGKQVFLAQSPQFYKQAMVGVFERVFEVAPVYRAEKHNTSRHLNEYTSLDLEMGFINSFHEIMQLEADLLKYTFRLLESEYIKELELLEAKVPVIGPIPVLKFVDAKNIIASRYKKEIKDYYDFEPEEEQLICDYALKEYGSELIFVTHYPSAKRPFYTMDDEEDPSFTLSFDLLFRGLEVTTGGQRIHDYTRQVEKMQRLGLNPDDFESYLMAHKNCLPPHGGLGIGLERLTMKLLNLSNVRYASLFPRDMDRVTP